MATIIENDDSLVQAANEDKPYAHDFGPEWFGVASPPTISSAAGLITNPAGVEAALTETPAVSGLVVSFRVLAAEVPTPGTYTVNLKATASNGDKPVAIYKIKAVSKTGAES